MKNLFQKLVQSLKSNQNIWKWALTVLGGLLILIILSDGVIMPIWVRHGWDTAIPDLMGMDLQKATSVLKDNSLGIEVVGEKYEPNSPAGTIVFQSPEPDLKVKKERVVKVTISRGGEKVTVPDVRGQPLEKAEIMLGDWGLRLGEVAHASSDSLPGDYVISTFPQVGSKVPAGMIVNLVVSQGTRADSTVVPDILGRNLEEGKKIAERKGITIGNIRLRLDQTLLPQNILVKSLKPGQKVLKGTKMDLIVSALED